MTKAIKSPSQQLCLLISLDFLYTISCAWNSLRIKFAHDLKAVNNKEHYILISQNNGAARPTRALNVLVAFISLLFSSWRREISKFYVTWTAWAPNDTFFKIFSWIQRRLRLFCCHTALNKREITIITRSKVFKWRSSSCRRLYLSSMFSYLT